MRHINLHKKKPERVIILGGNGFIGNEITNELNKLNVSTLPLGSKDMDLTQADAASKLSKLLHPKDVLIFVSAKAPCKDIDMLVENLKMAKSVCDAIKISSIEHLIYISSDAVYADSDELLNEDSSTATNSIHGVMHLTREICLKEVFEGPMAIVRPTLVYGAEDPHNGYGPNRFIRLSLENKDITLFGNGEERRDHIYVQDIAKLMTEIVLHKSEGVINAVTGQVVSFREIADLIVSIKNNNSKVKTTERVGEMPHNGFRGFDNSEIFRAFPDFKLKLWKDGINEIFKFRNGLN